MGKTTVLIADDHGIVRLGIRNILEEIDEIKIIGEATNGEDVLELIRKQPPDILILDLVMPKLSGIEVLKNIQQDETLDIKTLVVSSTGKEKRVIQVIEAGAYGFVSKTDAQIEIKKAMESLLQNKRYYNDFASEVMAKKIDSSTDKEKHNLTKREVEILTLLVKGKISKEIGDELYISTRTVDTHRNNIMKKLKVFNVAQMVAKAIKEGLVLIEPREVLLA